MAKNVLGSSMSDMLQLVVEVHNIQVVESH